MKTLLTALIIFTTIICHGQTTQTRFFRDRELTREVSERRANYSETVTKNSDGTIITEIKDLGRDEVILRNGEPFGIWTVNRFGEEMHLDYNFDLVYSEEECTDNIPGLNNSEYFNDDNQLGYIAPKIAPDDISITQYIRNNLHYPVAARQSGVSGAVYIRLTITKSGEIETLAIFEGVDVNLDKEAMRIMRGVTISEPPKINNQPIDVCIIFPIRFVLN